MDWPPVAVMLLTCARGEDDPRSIYAVRTLDAVATKLAYSGKLIFHIADDGSPAYHKKALVDLIGHYRKQFSSATMTDAEGHGYGASYNLATQVVHQLAPVVLPLEDDWELTNPLNIDGYVLALMSGEIRSIRMGYLGFTQRLVGELVNCEGKQYLKFAAGSEEPHVNAGHPRLESVAYERSVGPWAEGLNPGATEMEWCSRDNARVGVAWPLDTPPWYWFAHIGTKQARTDQREAVV